MLKPRSLNTHKNTAVPIIMILDHLEINTEVSDTGIETTESNDCKEVLENNRDTNGVLATTQKRARFFCKNE